MKTFDRIISFNYFIDDFYHLDKFLIFFRAYLVLFSWHSHVVLYNERIFCLCILCFFVNFRTHCINSASIHTFAQSSKTCNKCHFLKFFGKTKVTTVSPHIWLHALKSEVYQQFEFRLLVANCMQLLPEGLYSGPAIIGWGEVCSYHGMGHSL